MTPNTTWKSLILSQMECEEVAHECESVCIGVCVCMYMYIWVFFCVFVCLCVVGVRVNAYREASCDYDKGY